MGWAAVRYGMSKNVYNDTVC
eukprot:COSAG02_NODE_55192_length_292_cov_0.481865_1_plen_20_part_10